MKFYRAIFVTYVEWAKWMNPSGECISSAGMSISLTTLLNLMTIYFLGSSWSRGILPSDIPKYVIVVFALIWLFINHYFFIEIISIKDIESILSEETQRLRFIRRFCVIIYSIATYVLVLVSILSQAKRH